MLASCCESLDWLILDVYGSTHPRTCIATEEEHMRVRRATITRGQGSCVFAQSSAGAQGVQAMCRLTFCVSLGRSMEAQGSRWEKTQLQSVLSGTLLQGRFNSQHKEKTREQAQQKSRTNAAHKGTPAYVIKTPMNTHLDDPSSRPHQCQRRK
eukprot:1160832-Pelagomonas_calceolata.AAC.9